MASAPLPYGLQTPKATMIHFVRSSQQAFRIPIIPHIQLRFFLSALLVCFSVQPAASQMHESPNLQKPLLQRNNSARQAIGRLEQLEDERNYDVEEFSWYLHSPNARVRKRAALAIGRINDERGLSELLLCFNDDGNTRVRATAAFALGETESPRAAEDLLRTVTRTSEYVLVRARAAEALGKIMSNPTAVKTLGESKLDAVITALVKALPTSKANITAGSDEELFANLVTTALLRFRKPIAIPPLLNLLSSPNQSLRWHAANALSRLIPALRESAEAKSAVPALLSALSDESPFTRGLAARALGPMTQSAVTTELIKLLEDKDYNARISAIRALGVSGDQNAGKPLVAQLAKNLEVYRIQPKESRPCWEKLPYALELSTALGALRFKAALPLLEELRYLPNGRIGANPEVEIALARIDREAFLKFTPEQEPAKKDWHAVAAFASGFAELTGNDGESASPALLLEILDGKRFAPPDPRAISVVLTSLAKFKPEQLPQILSEYLKTSSDVIIRSTAAELLSKLPKTDELLDIFLRAQAAETKWNAQQNDAKLAILDAIAAYDNPRVIAALNNSLSDPDYLVRKKAEEKLFEKLADTDDFSERAKQIRRRVGIVKIRHDHKFYQQLSREYTRNPFAWIDTTKGKVQIELFIEDSPITVENFIHLAERDFFTDLAFHRVVPNFVVQGGDPRGDGNGGPNFQIRCEINERGYERGSVGMALSGKDTGGSQFFICHSPQPHLDGGYTIFAQVTQGMEVVDKLTRDDRIIAVQILR